VNPHASCPHQSSHHCPLLSSSSISSLPQHTHVHALYKLLYILSFTRFTRFTRFTYSDSGRVSKADGWRRHDTRLQAPLSDDRTLRAHTPGVPPLCSTHPSPPALLTLYLDPLYLLLRLTPSVSGGVTKLSIQWLLPAPLKHHSTHTPLQAADACFSLVSAASGGLGSGGVSKEDGSDGGRHALSPYALSRWAWAVTVGVCVGVCEFARDSTLQLPPCLPPTLLVYKAQGGLEGFSTPAGAKAASRPFSLRPVLKPPEGPSREDTHAHRCGTCAATCVATALFTRYEVV